MNDGQRFCEVCNGRIYRLRHDWLFRCATCACLSSTLEPNIKAEALTTSIDEDARKLGLDPIRQQNNARILDGLSRLGVKGGTLLDVGCGHGQMLEDAIGRGFHAIGIEPDGNVVERARGRTGAEVRQGFFPGQTKLGETFDVIVFNDVLEHIPGARGVIEASAHLLAPDGILVLNCPSQRGIFYRIANLLDRMGIHEPFGRLWQKDLPSPHVWYFSPDHLQKLGQLANLRTLLVETLLPIARLGLRERIFHVSGQSLIFNYLTYAMVWVAYPALNLCPRDIGVVFLGKRE